MQWLLDVITLKFFITPYVILLIYWFGALIAPLTVWLGCRWLFNKMKENEIAAAGIDELNGFVGRLSRSHNLKLYFWTLFTLTFLLAELLWRMLFEFLIAFFHIHDALIELSRHT